MGRTSTITGRGNTHRGPASFSPLREPCFPPRAGQKGEESATRVASAGQPRLCEEERRGGAQVARLSAGRPDMRIWELLLLRMESWVPPFTPLLARDGCRCLKSTAK